MWITYKLGHEPVIISFCLMTCSVNILPVHAQKHSLYLWVRKQINNAEREGIQSVAQKSQCKKSLLASPHSVGVGPEL